MRKNEKVYEYAKWAAVIIVAVTTGIASYHQLTVKDRQQNIPVELFVLKTDQYDIDHIVEVNKMPPLDTYDIYVMTPEDIAEEMYYDSLELLALCVEAEAADQGLEGKRLVVDVILNRVDDPDWPDTIDGVITQPYQFATYWDGAIERAEATEETYEAIRMELQERSNTEILYFTAGGFGNYGTPWKKVGDHYFCTK